MAKQTSSYIKLSIVSLIYTALCILYFSNIGMPYKIAIPVTSLLLSDLWVSPWKVAVAIACAAFGDAMGAQGNFLWQMSSFTLAHIFLIWYFFHRISHINGMTSVKNILLSTILVICVCAFALLMITPEAPSGILRNGSTVYAIVISIMLWCALLQKDAFYAIGACLFVISDMILGWNRFVDNIPYSTYLIMIPYYISQLLFFIRSAKI